MNRDKGFFRLALVLSPVFGMGLYLIDKLLFPYVPNVYRSKKQDFGSFAKWWCEVLSGEHHYYESGYGFFVFFVGAAIPFLAYLGYKFVLGGFYPEEDVNETRLAHPLQDLFDSDVDSDATKKTDDLDE